MLYVVDLLSLRLALFDERDVERVEYAVSSGIPKAVRLGIRRIPNEDAGTRVL